MQDLNDKITGSTLTANEWNEVPSEIQNVIESLNITLSAGDLNQLGKAVAGYIANGTFYTDSGAADAYVLTVIGSKQNPPQYTDGFEINFITTNANTGASTVNVATLGVKNIKLSGGDDPSAGEITGRIRCAYDVSNGWFELLESGSMPALFINDLRTIEPTVDGELRTISGHTLAGKGGGDFYYDASDVMSDDDNGTIIMTSGGARWKRVLLDYLTAQMYGAVTDWNPVTKVGANDALAIQRMINFLYNLGDTSIEIHITASSMHSGIVVIPDNMTVRGFNGHGWHRDRTETTGRGVIVGTYGPANSVSPQLETAYDINDAVNKDRSIIFDTPAEAANFAIGDVVGVQGDLLIFVNPLDTDLRKPNLVAEVIDIVGGELFLSRRIDDAYNNGSIRKLNAGTLPDTQPRIDALTDSTGFVWPLLVASNTRIIDVAFSNNENSEFSILNIALFRSKILNCTLDGNKGFGGNPVVDSEITGGHTFYGDTAYEFAYYSHDNIIDHEFVRKYDATVGGLNVGWDNTAEGCKRTTFINGSIDDGVPAVQQLNTLYLGKDSQCVNATITGDTKGVFGEDAKSIRKSTVTWRTDNATAGFKYGIRGFQNGEIIDNDLISNGTTEGDGIRAVNDVINTRISGNELKSADGTVTTFDRITLDLEAGSSPTVFNNQDITTVVKNRVDRRFSTDIPEVAGVAIIAALPIVAGEVDQGTEVHIDTTTRLESGQTLNVYIDAVNIATYTATDTTEYCRVVAIISAHGPSDTSYTNLVRFEAKGFLTTDTVEVDNLFSNTLPQWSTVTGVSVQVENMAGGKTAKVTRSTIQMGYYTSFNNVL